MNFTPILSSVKKFGPNFLASIVVFVVAIPLSLGIATASGTPASSAIVSMVIGGVIVGLFSGAPLVVSGPAAGLSAIVLHDVQTYGFRGVLTIAFLAGLIQISLAIFRLAGQIERIPKAVLEGVLSAIGLIIALGQIHVLLGSPLPRGTLSALSQIPSTLQLVFLSDVAWHASSVGLIALLAQLLWPLTRSKIPAALPAVILGTLLSLGLDMPRVEITPMVAYVVESTLGFGTRMADVPLVLVPALTLALVASAESLLTARAIDVLAQKKHQRLETNLDGELLAQGMGNLCAGVFGGMPLTGVMVRSAANLDAGATSRTSTIFHGVWGLLFVLAAPQMLNQLPLSVLASVLVLTGFKLLNAKHMLQSSIQSGPRGLLWPLTTIAVLATDLLLGLFVGILLGMVFHYFPRRSPPTRKAPPVRR